MTDEKKLSHKNAVASIAEGYVGCCWLGGPGFVFKTFKDLRPIAMAAFEVTTEAKDASISLDSYLSIVL